MSDAERTIGDFILPPSVVTRADVSRLVGEFEQVDAALAAAAIRTKTGGPPASVPTLSRPLTDFLVQNKQDVTDGRARSDLIHQLRELKDAAPTLHVTFAVESDPESLRQLVSWLRQTIHQHAVLAVGFQPSLIAGVYVRTPNQVHDLSLRAKLHEGHHLIRQDLEALRGRA